MHNLSEVPYARPVQTAVTRVEAAPLSLPPAVAGVRCGGNPNLPKTDGLAVASAICGFTAIVPFVSQVIGLGLGIASLVRLRRARRSGVPLRGAKWVAMGMTSSCFALVCWIGIFAAMNILSSSITHSVDSLNSTVSVVP